MVDMGRAQGFRESMVTNMQKSILRAISHMWFWRSLVLVDVATRDAP